MGGISVEGDTNVHGGAPFDKGLSSNVYIGTKKAATVGSGSTQNDTLYNQNRLTHPQGVSGNQTATGGSSTVYINGAKAHRIGDARIDGSTAGPGNPNVQIG